MRLTTICYIEKNDCFLMLHRTKKKDDQSHDKWIGVGGKLEKDESPDECIIREVREETGLTLTSYRLRGIMTFVSDVWETEYMFIYTADEFQGEIQPCEEGELQWVRKEEVMHLHLWEGDVLFLRKLIQDEEFFTLKVEYEGEKLGKAYEGISPIPLSS